MDLEKLAVNDKEMIDLQRRTIYMQQLEIQELQRKIKVLQRNMAAHTNATRNMHDEITLVKEDRVVLELHNQQIQNEKEQKEEQLMQEIAILKQTNLAQEKLIKKLDKEHSREQRNHMAYLKQMRQRASVQRVSKGSQTEESNNL